MTSIRRFEDLIAWQRARTLAVQVYRVTREGQFVRDFGLCDQVRRAATSTMANLAEGFERGRVSEFHQFVSTAKASCAELRSHLYLATDIGYLSSSDSSELMQMANELGRILGGLRAAVARERERGSVRISEKRHTPSAIISLSTRNSALTQDAGLRTQD